MTSDPCIRSTCPTVYSQYFNRFVDLIFPEFLTEHCLNLNYKYVNLTKLFSILTNLMNSTLNLAHLLRHLLAFINAACAFQCLPVKNDFVYTVHAIQRFWTRTGSSPACCPSCVKQSIKILFLISVNQLG